jgi:hypothetical protein
MEQLIQEVKTLFDEAKRRNEFEFVLTSPASQKPVSALYYIPPFLKTAIFITSLAAFVRLP